jgi:hypothetical protein
LVFFQVSRICWIVLSALLVLLLSAAENFNLYGFFRFAPQGIYSNNVKESRIHTLRGLPISEERAFFAPPLASTI